MVYKMAKKTATTENDNKEKIKKLIKEIEDLIKEKLKDKTFSNKNPFIDASKPIETSILIDSLPLALKNFEKKEEKNWIFYGPPGTGKTFALNKILGGNTEYVVNPLGVSKTSKIYEFVENLKTSKINKIKIFHDCLYFFLAKTFNEFGIKIVFHTHSNKANGGSGNEHILFNDKDLDYPSDPQKQFDFGFPFSTVKEYKNQGNDLNKVTRCYLPRFDELDCEKVLERLLTNDFSIWPNIEDAMISISKQIISTYLSVVTKIVFHPSYTYEDFIGGIKPDLVQIPLKGTPPEPSGPSSPNSLTYKYTPGVMLDLIRKAWGNACIRCYLIIDEFNRGNIAAIFGEFLYLIENDKRSEKKDSGNDYVFLPGGVYPWDDEKEVPPFSEECKIRMPRNIFIVGALNTADRSIATMDFAMRRRFNFVKFKPNEELIKDFNWNENNNITVNADNYLKFLFVSLNISINYKLDADHEIGHYYLMPAAVEEKNDTIVFLEDLFKQKIVPLLEAYCDHDDQAVNRILALTTKIMKTGCSIEKNGKIKFEILHHNLKTMDRGFPKDSKTEDLIKDFWDPSVINKVMIKNTDIGETVSAPANPSDSQ